MRLLPILFFVTYLNLTVLLFAFGPWPWPVKNGFTLYGFLAVAHLALLSGYVSAAFREPRGYFVRWKVTRVVALSLLVSASLLVPTIAFRTGSVIPDLAAALSDLGRAYSETNQLRAENTPTVEYFRVLLGPLLFWLLPLSVFYWNYLRGWVRVACVATLIGNVTMWIALGTNKGIADAVLLLPALLLAGHLSGSLRLTRGRVLAMIFTAGLALVAFLVFFTMGQISRAGGRTMPDSFASIGVYSDQNNLMVRYVPSPLQWTAIGLAGYVTHGYYALSLALQKPFVPTWGLGNSYASIRQAERVLGEGEVARRTYPFRIEEDGWDAYGWWSSIYPWIASDVSFPGAIVVVFLIGRLFALSWLETLRGVNPFAVALFSEFVIMLYYFPANNQVLQTPESFVAFFGTLALWAISRRKSVRVRE